MSRILYLDFDLHHGDGPSTAFFSTPSVLTLSVHLYAQLFFPSSGSLDSTGPDSPAAAAYHDLNVATREGLSSASLARLYDSCIAPVIEAYAPEAIVMQLGCDGLAEDPCAEWNLSLYALGECVRKVVEWRRGEGTRKALMLGGGGYSSANAARCWTYLTSVAVSALIPF